MLYVAPVDAKSIGVMVAPEVPTDGEANLEPTAITNDASAVVGIAAVVVANVSWVQAALIVIEPEVEPTEPFDVVVAAHSSAVHVPSRLASKNENVLPDSAVRTTDNDAVAVAE